ncbi:MAG: hypothetical protein PVI23_12830 [Maricaulaceae bacterium]|jgi:hypothetical protein
MSPELKRNLWLEFTASRVLIMTAVIALATFGVYLITNEGSAAVTDATFGPLEGLGLAGFVFITILWGSRNAARSVIGEMRERTWDFQRISAISPLSMTYGKLFGSTIYTWYGGLLCLAIATPGMAAENGMGYVVRMCGVYVASGLLGHSVAMISALATARRRRADARLAIFPHQAAGLIAALAPLIVATSALESTYALMERDWIPWWSFSISPRTLVLGSTFAFAAWAIVGCWREMRLELMERNAPIVWPAFLAFIVIYVLGFQSTMAILPPPGPEFAPLIVVFAYVAVMVAAYASLIIEPKNTVELRGYGAALMSGRLGEIVRGMPAYGWAFLVAILVAFAVVTSDPIPMPDNVDHLQINRLVVFAGLGFLARDIGIFHFFHARPGQKRGDFAALVTIALMFVLGSGFSGAADSETLAAAFFPHPLAASWTVALPWIQAGVVWMLAINRYRGVRTAPNGSPAIA